MTAHKKTLKIEIDTGAAVFIISKLTYDTLWSHNDAPPLELAVITLRTYTGEEVKSVGRINIDVEHGEEWKRLSLTLPMDWVQVY